MREEAIYLMARAMLLDILGAEQAKPDLRLVRCDGKAPLKTEEVGQSAKKPLLRPLERRRLAASS